METGAGVSLLGVIPSPSTSPFERGRSGAHRQDLQPVNEGGLKPLRASRVRSSAFVSFLSHGIIPTLSIRPLDEYRAMNIEDHRASLEARNELRRQCQLPLVNVEKELERHRGKNEKPHTGPSLTPKSNTTPGTWRR